MNAFTHAVDAPSPALFDHTDLARLRPHRGTARYAMGGETFSGTAEFNLPVSGHAIIAFATTGERSDQDLGEDLVIEGHADDAPFTITCPYVHVKHANRVARKSGGWSLFSPTTAPARIDYHYGHGATRVAVLLNNFDYHSGDAVESNGGATRLAIPFTSNIGARAVVFSHTPKSIDIRPLASTRVIRTASLVECAFSLRDGEGDDELLAFATDIAGLCTLVAGGTVGVAMLTLLDDHGRAIRRIVPQPVISGYRRNEIVEDRWLPQFLSSTYPAFTAMKQAHAPWRKLVSYCGSLDDPPYLEQKFASLMMALDFFIRNCLVEHGKPEKVVAGLEFQQLIGAARRELGWNIPKHYMVKGTIRIWRNAVVHGDALPEADTSAFRRLFEKWRLFLFRRVLIRLGYHGQVSSPQKGWGSSPPVGDFTEEHNAFVPVAPEEMAKWREFKEHIKTFNSQAKAAVPRQAAR